MKFVNLNLLALPVGRGPGHLACETSLQCVHCGYFKNIMLIVISMESSQVKATIFIARRCASVVHAVTLRLSVTTHTHPRLTALFSGAAQVGWYQKGQTNQDLTEARDSEWQWRQLGHMQVCTSLQTDDHASTSALSFLQAGCPSCCPTNSVKALNATYIHTHLYSAKIMTMNVRR